MIFVKAWIIISTKRQSKCCIKVKIEESNQVPTVVKEKQILIHIIWRVHLKAIKFFRQVRTYKILLTINLVKLKKTII